MIEIITAEEFKKNVFDYTASDDLVFEKERPVIVNFFADWCGPCRAFAPTLENVATKSEGLVNVYKVNIDHHPEVPALFGIRSVPTTVFLAAGSEPALATGMISEDGMAKALKELFGIDI